MHTNITCILGVDYTHPALGGCFGQGCKFAYGYDLVGNNFNGSTSSIEESNDPIDNCPVNSSKLFLMLYKKKVVIIISCHIFIIYLASATGHGTFVSGIIGAEDLVYVCLFFVLFFIIYLFIYYIVELDRCGSWCYFRHVEVSLLFFFFFYRKNSENKQLIQNLF